MIQLAHIPGVVTLDADDRRIEMKARKRGFWPTLQGVPPGSWCVVFDVLSGGGRISRHYFLRHHGYPDPEENGLQHILVIDRRKHMQLTLELEMTLELQQVQVTRERQTHDS